jgi:hypothetical protein
MEFIGSLTVRRRKKGRREEEATGEEGGSARVKSGGLDSQGQANAVTLQS